MDEESTPTLTVDDAPQALASDPAPEDEAAPSPTVLQLTEQSKRTWIMFLKKCEERMSPAELLEYLRSEKARILKKRGKITQEEVDFLNNATREGIEEVVDEIKKKLLKVTEVTREDTTEEVVVKVCFARQACQWLADLCRWLMDKIKIYIIDPIKEKIVLFYEEAMKFLRDFWSRLFSHSGHQDSGQYMSGCTLNNM